MTISWRIRPEVFLDRVELERVNEAALLLGLGEASAIESYVMSADGPRLENVVLVSKEYVAEVRIASQELDFDIIPADLLLNIRVKRGSVPTVKPPSQPTAGNPAAAQVEKEANPDTTVGPIAVVGTAEAVPITYVEIVFKHGESMGTKVSYFGSDANDWLKYVLRVYPKEILLKGPRAALSSN